MFLDEAQITVHGGKGGDGLVCWRREKFIAKGGPWGGDGGNGGNIVFVADENTDTLSAFAREKVFSAENGESGKKSRKHGKRGKDLILKVPPGTVIFTADKTEPIAISDLKTHGDKITAARGGRGGYGNAHFASSVRQAPDFAEKGEPGETKILKLELKLVADVGIIGYPNTGKSTLISVISSSRPKIGNYPFTTITPNLGVVSVHGRKFTACDIPGLIEGASNGRGLGDAFLRHIERCAILVHLLDISRKNMCADYHKLRAELRKYSSELAGKRELVVLNKIDLCGNDTSTFENNLARKNIAVFASVSSATKSGINHFLNKLLAEVMQERKRRRSQNEFQKAQIPVLTPHLTSDKTGAFIVDIANDGTFVVRGKRIEQIAKMTDWENESALSRFRDISERIGLIKALERAGASADSEIKIGKMHIRCLF